MHGVFALKWCYQETRWLGMRRQSESRAGNHRRHTRTPNASPPTQANNAARAANSNHPTRVRYMHLSKSLLLAYAFLTTASLCKSSKTPHTDHPASCAIKAETSQHGTHRGCNRNLHGAPGSEIKLPRRPTSRPDTAAPARWVVTDQNKFPRVGEVQNLNANTHTRTSPP